MRHFLILIVASTLVFSCKDKSQKKTQKEENIEDINFVDKSFRYVLNKAEQENKLVFVDCYTSWCAPCKWMEKNIFVEKEVYSFYNSNFINFEIDMEKGEGPELAKQYNVTSFPTYLFLDSNGKLIHFAKSKMEAKSFIEEGKKAMDPERALGVLADKFNSNNITKKEMLEYVVSLKSIRDERTTKVYKSLISNVDTLWMKSSEGWRLITNFVSQDTTLFNFLEAHKKHFIANEGKQAVNKLYARVIQRKMNKSIINKDEETFNRQLDSLKRISDNHRNIAIIECRFYLESDNASKFIEKSNYYVDKFFKNDPGTISFLARTALNNDNENREILQQSAVLIDQAYDLDPDNYGIVSTYSQIHNEIGDKEGAVKAAKKAVKIADTITSKIKRLAEENLEKIKK